MIDTTGQPLLLLGCVRQVGKDTLAGLLHQLDPRFTAFSFASPLKNDLKPFLLTHYGIDVWRCTLAEKETIRPLLIAHGMAKRSLDADYWVKRTLRDIQLALHEKPGIIPVITDGRFVNEIRLARQAFPQTLFVNVCREGAPPPTDEEEKHYREVTKLADRTLLWGNETPEEQLGRAREVMGWLDL